MAMCRPREIGAFGKPPRQPLEREQLRTLKHLSATLRYAFLLMDAQASDCLGSNPSRLRANSQVTALGAERTSTSRALKFCKAPKPAVCSTGVITAGSTPISDRN